MPMKQPQDQQGNVQEDHRDKQHLVVFKEVVQENNPGVAYRNKRKEFEGVPRQVRQSFGEDGARKRYWEAQH